MKFGRSVYQGMQYFFTTHPTSRLVGLKMIKNEFVLISHPSGTKEYTVKCACVTNVIMYFIDTFIHILYKYIYFINIYI